MALPADIAQEAQKLSTDRLVTMYELDATELGGIVMRFCSSVDARLSISSLTAAGTVATLNTSTPHTMSTGGSLRVVNASPNAYNGDFSVTVVDADTLTYNMASAPGGSATGAYLEVHRLNNTVRFGGNDYTPIEIDVSGFEYSGQESTLPTPHIVISNKHQILLSAVIALNDLVGAQFTRIRTFRKHLDDGIDPDVNMIFPKEIYVVNRKVAQNKIFMEFELASPLDQEGIKIPRNQCLRDTCLHRYRIWNGSTFVYTDATCPYTGSTYFTQAGTSTPTASLDRCGKHLTDCKLRFGGAPLPIRATPGIGGR